MPGYFAQLKTQRWDDHRYYHHSRINQTLHLISACSFLVAYALLFIDPALAALVAWLFAMTTRQSGHFFFEPDGYDTVNQATHEYKEEIKVGYNLQRKRVLLLIWAAAPVILLIDPTCMGLFEANVTVHGFLHNLGMLWLYVGAGGLVFRTIHLFFIKDVMAGLVWASKIITDPVHDIYLYHKAPLALLRGELIEQRQLGDHTA